MIKTCIIFISLLTTYVLSNDNPPVGIDNAGNTCFMNSALQCLYHSKDLTNYLKGLPIARYKKGSASRAYINFLNIYQNHAQTAEVIESEIAKINWCVRLTQLIPLTGEEKRAGHKVKPFGQTQDASELAVQLIQHLILKDINPHYFGRVPKYPFPLYPLPKNKLTDLLVTIILESKYPINRESQQQIEPPLISSSEQYILPISIVKDLAEDIPPAKDTVKIFDSLDSALANTFNKKNFSPAEAHNPFYKIKTILKLPEMLIIALDRFTYLVDSAEDRNKIYNKIPFPVNDLSFKNYLANRDSQQSEYDLYGIVMHHYEGAHYTAYVKVENQWYHCDDFNVNKIEESKVIALATAQGVSGGKVEIRSDIDEMEPRDHTRYVTPYMLFYKQKPGKRVDLKQEKITIKTQDLEKILLNQIPENYLPLLYLEMYMAQYKLNLDLIAQGINEGLVNIAYVRDAFGGWLEDAEKRERRNVLIGFTSSLSALSARL